MKNFRFNVSIAAVFALTVLFIPVGDAFAQTQVPLFGDDIVASIKVGSVVHVAPVEHQGALEAEHGTQATVGPMNELVATLSEASSGDTVRIEGGYAAGMPAMVLSALGYTVSETVPSSLIGVDDANVLSD